LVNGRPGVAENFLAYAAADPRLRDWEITIREDNGIVEEIEAGRRDDPLQG